MVIKVYLKKGSAISQINMESLRIHPRIEKRFMKGIIEIDRLRFNETPSPAFFDYANNFPNNYTVLTLDDNVEGYGLVVPVTLFGSQAMQRGEMDENELIAKHATNLDNCDAFYLPSIAVRPKTKPIISSRLVGYTLGGILRAQKPAFAIAVSKSGESIAKEIGMESNNYVGPLQGLDGFVPKLFKKPAYGVN